MATELASFLHQTIPDPWRASSPFTPHIADALDRIRSAATDDLEIKRIMSDWLRQYQPCLFGKIAARANLIEYCIIRESEIEASDEAVAKRIEDSRLNWHGRTWDGDDSAFVIAVLSDKLALAMPNETVKKFAQHLCGLYLTRSIETDRVYLDSAYPR